MGAAHENFRVLGIVVRGVCGAVFGGIVGVGFWWEMVGGGSVWMVVLGFAAVCGFLAVVMQDDFWTEWAEWFRWW